MTPDMPMRSSNEPEHLDGDAFVKRTVFAMMRKPEERSDRRRMGRLRITNRRGRLYSRGDAVLASRETARFEHGLSTPRTGDDQNR
ncbi:MAG: hypothetical protein ACOYXR_11605 [Nitrospirota bacterium]